MKSFSPGPFKPSSRIAVILLIATFSFPLRAQQPAKPPAPVAPANNPAPMFDTLLSADSYKLYGEVRNVGALLTTGGAGEIVEPIIKLADPGPEFKSIVSFLKKNSEALATSRLMFAGMPARQDLPTAFVAIEFGTPEEAEKFAPKLETFLPTVLPPVTPTPTPEPTPEEKAESTPEEKAESSPEATPVGPPTAVLATKPIPVTTTEAPMTAKTGGIGPAQEPKPQFVLSHTGNLVFISDKPFKLEQLRSKTSGLLAEDHNFRVARDRFSSEPVFIFINVALEDRTKPKPPPTPEMTEEEEQRIQAEAEAAANKMIEEQRLEREKNGESNAQLVASIDEAELSIPEASPTPTPTKEEEAQRVASNQIGSMLGMLGQGEPQWPEAIGIALALDNEEYVARAILIDAPESKRLTLPFIPQLISGPIYTVDAPSVLPDDTEIFVSASIDFAQSYREMKKQSEEAVAKNKKRNESATARASLDGFAEFEKKAGIKIADDLLPVIGNELAVAASLKTINQFGIFGVPAAAPAKSSGDDAKTEKPENSVPIFLLAIRDRETARRLVPKVMDGLGLGAANLLAQTERRGDAEIVSYAGMLAYGFIGNFLVISDAATVRRVADANANRQTLSANNTFRSARHWEPKQTLGEVYVSPALMEGYQEQIGKQSSMMDAAVRDFLMQLSPKSTAITYALSHDGLGTIHEVRLPKNLILVMVASTSAAMSAMKQGSPEMNEMIAMSGLQMIVGAEATYKAGTGKGTYGSIEMLANEKLVSKEVFEKYGYRYDLYVSGDHFEARATPQEYPKSGKRSFFVDESGVVRGDDHGGGPANSSDKPAQ